MKNHWQSIQNNVFHPKVIFTWWKTKAPGRAAPHPVIAFIKSLQEVSLARSKEVHPLRWWQINHKTTINHHYFWVCEMLRIRNIDSNNCDGHVCRYGAGPSTIAGCCSFVFQAPWKHAFPHQSCNYWPCAASSGSMQKAPWSICEIVPRVCKTETPLLVALAALLDWLRCPNQLHGRGVRA